MNKDLEMLGPSVQADQSVEKGTRMKVVPLTGAKTPQSAEVAKRELGDDPAPSGDIGRTRLADWRIAAVAAKIFLLQAPAGYGKSTILRSWAAELRGAGRTVVWLACRKGDEDAARFRVRLRNAFESTGVALERQDAANAADKSFSSELWLDAIESTNRPIDVFVDEDAVCLSPVSRGLLWDLAQRTPRTSIYVASRHSLTSGLARARTQGAVATLNANDIGFDRLEARSCLQAAGLDVDSDELDAIMDRTLGWPMAIRMMCRGAGASYSLRNAADALVAGSELADFFAEEVDARLDREAGDFLKAIAILDEVNASLCDAVTGSIHSKDLLERIADHGAFLTRSDRAGWFRLHPMFAAHLRRHEGAAASDEAIRGRHLRALEWFDRAGMFLQTFDHAIQAGDVQRAAQVLDVHCDDFYMSGLERSILPTTLRLPEEVRQRYPRILLAMSWRLMAEWRFESASVLLQTAEARFREMREGSNPSAAKLADLEREIRHRHIMLALFREDFGRVNRDSSALLKDVEGRGSPYVVMSLYAAMLYAHREQYQLGSLENLEALAREQLDNVPSQYMHVFFEAIAAPGRLLRGDTDAVVGVLQRALQTAVSLSGRGSAVPATVALTLSEALYARNDLDEAQQLLNEYLRYATDAGFVDQLISGYLTQARLLRHRGLNDAALITLQEAETFAAERQFHRLGTMAFAERISLLCHMGEEEEAVRIAGWQGVRLSASPTPPQKDSTRGENAMAMAWVHLAQARGQIDVAQQVAKAWRNYANAARAVPDVVAWDILRAQLLLGAADVTGAQRLLLQALVIAAPAKRVRAFVDEATRLSPIIESLSQGPRGEGLYERFSGIVLAAIAQETGIVKSHEIAEDKASDQLPMADLTARELGILKLVAAGHLNAEIGKRLGLTPGTVKWYLHRIYGKLGCRRRISAIEQGRRLGLIS